MTALLSSRPDNDTLRLNVNRPARCPSFRRGRARLAFRFLESLLVQQFDSRFDDLLLADQAEIVFDQFADRQVEAHREFECLTRWQRHLVAERERTHILARE